MTLLEAIQTILKNEEITVKDNKFISSFAPPEIKPHEYPDDSIMNRDIGDILKLMDIIEEHMAPHKR